MLELKMKMLGTSCFSEQHALALKSEVRIQSAHSAHHAHSAYQHRCRCAVSARCVEVLDCA
jgi:hypothetical protein